jgi:hypothetical protein
MLRAFGLVPFAVGIALLSCEKADPVDDAAAGPPDSLVGDASAVGLAAPANAATAEAMQQAALPDATGGLGWTYRETDRAALFGPPGNPAFSIQCQKQREGESQLIFIRYLPPTTGSQATLSFTGNGHAASVPIAAVGNPGGAGGHWHAAISPSDSARDIAEAFAGPGTVEVSIGGTPPLVVSASAEARRALSTCLSA